LEQALARAREREMNYPGLKSGVSKCPLSLVPFPP